MIATSSAYFLENGGEEKVRYIPIVSDPNDRFAQFILPRIIGKGGKNLNRLRLETGVYIDIHLDGMRVEVESDNPEKLANAVDHVEQEIEKLKKEYDRIVIIAVDTDDDVLTYVNHCMVGNFGEHIIKLRDEIGVTNISLRGDRFTIQSDDPETLTRGKERLEHEIEKCQEQYKKSFKKTISLENQNAGYIMSRFIGLDGHNIKRVREETGVIVLTSKAGNGIVIISDDSDKFSKAVEYVEGEIKLFAERDRNQLTRTVSLDLNNARIESFVRARLIGQRGDTVNKFRDEHGVFLSIKDKHVELRSFSLDNVTRAAEILEQSIQKYAKEGSDMKAERITLDGKDEATKAYIRGRLIGRQGRNIARISNDTGVHIDVTEDFIEFQSKDPEKCANAVRRVESEIETSAHQFSKRISERIYFNADMAPSDFMRTRLIGKGGQNINRMVQDMGVFIRVDEDCVQLSCSVGDSDKLAYATEHVEKQIGMLQEHYNRSNLDVQ